MWMMRTSKRAGTIGAVAFALLAGIAPGTTSSGAAVADPTSSSLASCAVSAAWATDIDPFDPMRATTVPATITMADGTSQPVGVVTPPSSETRTGSTDLSWSPDGTALTFWQVTAESAYVQTVTAMIADWDGSNPVPMPGMPALWSPTSDHVLATSAETPSTHIGRRTPSGWDFVSGPSVGSARTDAAWSSDGTILAWIDPADQVWAGDADGRGAHPIGQATGDESPLQFKPNSHLVRVAGPTWFDVDANAAAGPAPTGRISPDGAWSAWPTNTFDVTSDLNISHDGGPPVKVTRAAWFLPESLSWSPDSRYLVVDDFEILPTEHRWAPLLYDTDTGSATIVGPGTSIDLLSSQYVGLNPTAYEWAPGSASYLARESTWSAAAGNPPAQRSIRYDIDGTRSLLHDWGFNVGATFWPRATPVTHLELAAHLDAVGADGFSQLHVTVTNDGPCDAADVVIDIATPADSLGVSAHRAVQTFDLGLVRRGEVVERVFDVVPNRDLPLTIAVDTSTDDAGRNAAPRTLTAADIPTSPADPAAALDPAPIAVASPATPSFTG
jgi:hypothetical protein